MAVRFAVEGLEAEWESLENVRGRLRSEDGRLVIPNEDGSYDPNNRLAIQNLEILAPMLVRMTLCSLKIPDIEPLRSTLQKAYQLFGKEPSESEVDDEAWALRHLVGHVKRKTQKQLVSLEPDFQDMCLILNPDLEELVQQIRDRGVPDFDPEAEETVEVVVDDSQPPEESAAAVPEPGVPNDPRPEAEPAEVPEAPRPVSTRAPRLAPAEPTHGVPQAAPSEPTTVPVAAPRSEPPTAPVPDSRPLPPRVREAAPTSDHPTRVPPTAPASEPRRVSPAAPTSEPRRVSPATPTSEPTPEAAARPEPTPVAEATRPRTSVPEAVACTPTRVLSANTPSERPSPNQSESSSGSSGAKKLQLKMLQDELARIREKRAKMERLADSRASAGHPVASPSDELVTPPPKTSVLPDNADTQLYDVMEEPLAPLTPKFNKPTRMPSTASVDTKRWVYQHPGVPKPKACEPRALLQEPLPVQKDDEVATDAQVQEAEPMEEDAELMEEDAEQMEKGAEQVEEEAEQMEEEAEEEPVRTKGAPSKVFGRRDQLGLRTSIKAKAKSKKAAAETDAEEDGVSAKKRAKKLKRKASRTRRSKKQKLSRSQADEEEPEHEAENADDEPGEDGDMAWGDEDRDEPTSNRKPKAKATPKGKSGPKAKAKATPKGKSGPKAKAAPKGKSAPKAKATPAKSSSSKQAEVDEDAPTKPKGGRPKGSKNKAKEPAEPVEDQKKKRAPRVAPSIRLNSKTADDTPHDPLDLKYLLEFWSDFEDPNADLAILKKEVKAWKPVFAYVSPDIYWSRKECALTFHYETEDGEPCKSNLGHFHFTDNKCGLLVAIACAYLLAWFIEEKNILDPRHADIAPKVLSLKAAGFKAIKELGASGYTD